MLHPATKPFRAPNPSFPAFLSVRFGSWPMRTGKSDIQPFPADGGVGGECCGRPLEHDAAVAHHIEAPGNLQRNGELLLDQQDSCAAACDFVEQRADLLDQLWRETL